MSILLGKGVNLNTITTTDRNAGVSTATGTLIYNSTSQQLEVYKGSEYGWVAANDEFIEATGGTVSEYVSGNRLVRAHVFYSSGIFNIIKGTGPNSKVDILVVGGGGGGGSLRAGGGGAGGFSLITEQSISPGIYEVFVGSGGGGSLYAVQPALNGTGSSVEFGVVVRGGGGGAGGSGNAPPTSTESPGNPGGSGGGAASVSGTNHFGGSGISGQGNPGGNVIGSPGGGELGGAGGGGAGAAGSDSIIPNGDTGQPGGVGLLNAFSGTSTYYAGGGGGGAGNTAGFIGGAGGLGGGGNGGTNSVDDVQNGAENTGGGGGGGGDNERGGNGGSGIVIIRYNISNIAGTAKATGGTIRFDAGKTIHEFRSSGTFTRTDPTLTSVDVLQVAGGGSGGVAFGGGGGAGGLVFRSGAPISPTHTITVGAGGVSRLPSRSPTLLTQDFLAAPLFKGTNGSNTVGIVTTCIGGGAGGANPSPERAGNPGGSGGGYGQRTTPLGVGAGTPGQGNPGGPLSPADDTGTGGGGAGAVGGSNAAPLIGGNGGDGLLYSISGTPTYYAGGGGGGTRITGSGGLGGLGGGGANGTNVSPLNAGDGEPGTGGGGAGGLNNPVPTPPTVYPAGNGGSGIVIISYPT